MGVFSAKNSPNMDVKRNTFPLSFSNNLTMQFGKIYPVFVKPCDPGDSFNIKASFGLNFLPTVYPVQTPMKAYLHFFYCRNRTVWTDFMNFYTMKDRAGTNIASSTYVPPYLDFSKQLLGASELADYMGIPIPGDGNSYPLKTLSISDYTIPTQTNSTKRAVSADAHMQEGKIVAPAYMDFSSDTTSSYTKPPIFNFLFPVANTLFSGKTINSLRSDIALNPSSVLPFNFEVEFGEAVLPDSSVANLRGITQAVVNGANIALQALSPTFLGIALYTSSGSPLGIIDITDITQFVSEVQYSGDSSPIVLSCSFKGTVKTITLAMSADPSSEIGYMSLPLIPSSSEDKTTMSDWDRLVTYFYSAYSYTANSYPSTVASFFPLYTGTGSANIKPPRIRTFSMKWNSLGGSVQMDSPYYDSVNNPNGLKISSLPFRHYEAIYNYFYRDNRNNPLRNSDGLPVYNEVLLPSQLTGGVETGAYDFHYRNWEQDFLTTCVQEPQLGQAPLVGISSTGVASFSNEDGSVSNVQLKVAEDGDTVVGFETSEGMTAPVAHSLVELATQGISISDFRNVNAFQTWLEVQMRKTLRFGDSIQGHFNVNPKYDDYLYPEFIGGVTQEIDTYQVNQTSPSVDSPLGAYAGQAICKGSVPRAISKFCDEPGYIIGLLSIVPQPVYSQILPKHYLRRETLDYHFPEFNNISYQPVTYAEVCPVLAFNENKNLNSVFGYQRPWYDLISSLDEAHGQFLTTLNGFILSRRFVSYPTLGDRFLTVHPEDLNDIFSTAMTDSNDVILGQIYFDVVKKTSVSKFGIPSLQIG